MLEMRFTGFIPFISYVRFLQTAFRKKSRHLIFLFHRTVPLYLFAPMDEQPLVHLTEYGDSGVVSSTQSTTDPRSASTLSR